VHVKVIFDVESQRMEHVGNSINRVPDAFSYFRLKCRRLQGNCFLVRGTATGQAASR
jgi:hypothetical protein